MRVNMNRHRYLAWYLLGFFFLIKPDYFSFMGSLTLIYNIGCMISLVFIFISIIKYRSLSKLYIYCFVIIITPLVIGLLEGVTLTLSLLFPVFQSLGLASLIYIGTKKNFQDLMVALAIILEVYTYINLITILLYPSGIYDAEFYSGNYWFLGYKNTMIKFLLPSIAINSIVTVIKKSHYTLRFLLLCVAVVATLLLVDCKTGLIGTVFMLISLFIFSQNRLPKWVNLKTGIAIVIILSIIIATTSVLKVFSPILLYLGEDVSVMHRLDVWIRSFELISKSPIWGYGLRTNEGYRQLINLSTGWGYFSHPHNFILYTLLQGGILIVALVVKYLSIAGNICLKNRNNFISKGIILIYAAFFITGMTESLTEFTLFYPLLLLTKAIEKNNVEYKKVGILNESFNCNTRI